MVKRKDAPTSMETDHEPCAKRRSTRLMNARDAMANARIFPTFRTQTIAPEDNSKAAPTTNVSAPKSLRNLLELPLEIIYEVLRHLSTKDLLNLSNAVEMFRTFLLQKSSASIWTAARANVPDLPPLMEGMDEVAYARMLFDDRCQICYVRRARGLEMVYALHMRICGYCQRSSPAFSREDSLEIQLQPPLIDQEEFLSFVPHIDQGWLPSMVQDYMKVYKELVVDEQTLGQWKAKMLEEMKKRDQWSDYHSDWLDICAQRRQRQIELRKKENDVIRLQRFETIINKVIALGFKKDDIPPGLADHPYVTKPQALTEKEWAKIGPTLVEYIKAKIQDAERSKKLRENSGFGGSERRKPEKNKDNDRGTGHSSKLRRKSYQRSGRTRPTRRP
ncbi:hypothetical protein FB446DRAFT_740490 [Lentinula raphanica]|nr:hypothetical protein FB446DRAFT_740490 [Lentinula raphanica]